MAETEDKSECVKVVVRCRPLSQREIDSGNKKVVFMNQGLGQVIVKAEDQEPKTYTYDHVYDDDSQQLTIYQECAHPIVESVMTGYNGTIFAYGQTGSGKTHTMEGKGSPEERGVIPNAFLDIFTMISHETHKQFLVRCSYLEIYQEEIFDLLAKRKKVELREDKDKGVYVKGLTYIGIKNEKEIEKVMDVGKKNRKVGATAMNPSSSRSHSIFTITVESSEMRDDGENHVTVGKLNLVDLAGSERQLKTQAEGDRLKEAIKINLSLSALGNVIKALVTRGASGHVPYRDSKLTRLLQDSLGGNTKTVMLAAVGPADYNVEETLNTLRYATRAKSIKNKPKINEDPKDAMIRQFQEEIERLKRMLESQASGGADAQRTVADAAAAMQAAGVVGAALTEEQLRRHEQEKVQLLEEKGAVEASLKKTEEDLIAKQQALEKERQERLELIQKLQALEGQVVAGGMIMEKAREQEMLLQTAEEKMRRHQMEQQILRQELETREQLLDEHIEKFVTVQEEVAHKTKLLKKAHAKLQEKQVEMEELQAEFGQERDDMLDTIRELARQLKYQKAMIDTLIPAQDISAIETCLEWDEELDDWVLIRPVVSPVQRELKLKDVIIDAFIPPSELQKIVKRAEWDSERGEYRIQRMELAGNRIRAGGRPPSAFGHARPMSAFARTQALSGNADPRYRSENIIDVEVEMPERHTQDLDDLQDVSALLETRVDYPGRENYYYDQHDVASSSHGGERTAGQARPPSRRQRPKTATKKPPMAPGSSIASDMMMGDPMMRAGAQEVVPRTRGLVRPPSARR